MKSKLDTNLSIGRHLSVSNLRLLKMLIKLKGIGVWRVFCHRKQLLMCLGMGSISVFFPPTVVRSTKIQHINAVELNLFTKLGYILHLGSKDRLFVPGSFPFVDFELMGLSSHALIYTRMQLLHQILFWYRSLSRSRRMI